MHDDRGAPPPSSQNVIPIDSAATRARAERKARNGKRHFIARVDPQAWRTAHDGQHLTKLILQMGYDGGVGEELRALGIRQPHLGRTDQLIMLTLAVHRPGPRITSAWLGRYLGISKMSANRVVQRLAAASVVVNIGTQSRRDLALDPEIGRWDLGKLEKLRKASNSARRGGKKLEL